MKLKVLLSRLLYVVVALLTFNSALAQNKIVSGVVTDSKDRQPLIGVSVKVKGTTGGTTTGVDGSFRISIPASANVLELSYVGYDAKEVDISGKTSVSIAMEASSTSLSEVVVVGYGTQKVKDATGSVASLGTKNFNKGVISSPEQLLQGRVAGVQVTPASGEPGAGISINIRGTGSIRSGNNPLFVVDGVPIDNSGTSGGLGVGGDSNADKSSARNPLAFLNPSDIENISVLKDASASAIYGSRGANGVVLITTKKGTSGQRLQFGASTSISKTAKRYDLLSGPAFLDGVQRAGGDSQSPAVNGGANVDWQDQIFQTGVSQNYNLAFGGLTQNTNYRFAFGYDKQEGTVKTSALQRYTGRLNASRNFLDDKLKLEMAVTGSKVKNTYAPVTDNSGFQGSLIGAAIIANPTFPVRAADGTFYTPGPTDPYRNPAAMLAYIDDRDDINRLLGNVSATLELLPGLSAKSLFSLDNSRGARKTWYDPRLRGYNDNTSFRGKPTAAITGNGRGVVQHLKLNNFLVEHTLNYDKRWGESAFTALIGYSYQKFRNYGYNEVAFNTVNPGVLTKSLSGFSGRLPVFGDSTKQELQSYYTRINYNLNDKYLLTATLRADGSSKFGLNNKYGYFPALAAKWKIMNESFGPKKVFDDLSLRLNYGVTGNQEFPGGVSQAIIQHQFNGDVPLNAANPNLKWETTTQYGAGLDFAILKSRLSGTVDYFYKSTKDLLFLQDYAQPAAVARRWVNLPGKVINQGVEVGLTAQAFQGPKFSWEILYNMTFLDNKVKDFGNRNVITGDINGQGLSGAYAQVITNGQPLASFSVAKFDGFDAEGFGIYPNGDAQVIVGSALPTFNAGFTSNFTFGRFNASFFLNASRGFYIYNNTANALFLKGSLKTAHNVTVDVANSPENPINPGSVSTRFLEKGDFIRLSNASIGYNLDLKNSSLLKSLRLTLSGQNLFLITDYSGLDPEINTNKARNEVPSRGIDYTAYPNARTFTLGLNAGF